MGWIRRDRCGSYLGPADPDMIIAYLRSLCVAWFFGFSPFFLQAQCLSGWARQGGGEGTDFGRSVAVDAGGNILVTGSFAGSATFSGVSISSTDVDEDVFLAKYAADGTLLWIRTGGGTNMDQAGKVTVDGEGNAYITGTHFREADFGGIHLSNAAEQPNAFVVKYGPDGDVLWAITLGGDGWDSGDAVAYDTTTGHLYVGGQFEGSAQFGGQSAMAVSQKDQYIAEVDADGDVVGLNLLGPNTGNEQVRGLTVGEDGSLYAVGTMDGTFNGWQTYTSAGAHDCMLLKFGPGPELQWVRFGGGPADDLWNEVAVDPDGGIFAHGVVSENAAFGSETLTGAGDKDQVLAKYAADGELAWIRSGGGSGMDAGGGVVELGNGHALITGSFQGTANFGGTGATATGGSDILMVEYDGSGAVASVAHWGQEGDNFGYGLARGLDGALYLTGQFESSLDIGDTLLQSSGGREVFIHQVCDGTVGISGAADVPSFLISPNPVAAGTPWSLAHAPCTAPAQLLIIDAWGRQARAERLGSGQGTVSLPGLASGVYTVRLACGQDVISARLLVVD